MTRNSSPTSYQRGAAAGEIYRVLRDDILTLVLEPGQPLDETSLSKRFAVSRSPVREALNRLFAERLVETLPNRSTIVAQVDLRNFPAFILALDVQQLLDSADRVDVMRDQHHNFVDVIERQDVAGADAIAHAHTMQFHDRLLKELQYAPEAGFALGLNIPTVQSG